MAVTLPTATVITSVVTPSTVTLPVSVCVPASQVHDTGWPPEVTPAGPLSDTDRSPARLSGSAMEILPVDCTDGSPTAAMPPGRLPSETMPASVAVAVGGSFTGLTVTVTVLVVVPPWPSLTVTVKLSVPWKLAPGV
ncbi:hypothetical protein FQZ97_950350 [compost metagenome]